MRGNFNSGHARPLQCTVQVGAEFGVRRSRCSGKRPHHQHEPSRKHSEAFANEVT